MTGKHEKMRIAGQLVDGDCGTLEVFNPYNGEVVGTVPRASREQVARAFEIAGALGISDAVPAPTRSQPQPTSSSASRGAPASV